MVLNSCNLILIKVFSYSDLRQLQPQWEMHTGSLTCLYTSPSHLCSIPQLSKSKQRDRRLHSVGTYSNFFSCTVIQINPVKSLINGSFFSLVRSYRLFSFLNKFSTIQTLYFKWMHKVCLCRITKKVSPLQPVFRFRLFCCKINFIKVGLLVKPCSPTPTYAQCGSEPPYSMQEKPHSFGLQFHPVSRSE